MTRALIGSQIALSLGLASVFGCSRTKTAGADAAACQSACKRLASPSKPLVDDGAVNECTLTCLRDFRRARAANCDDQHLAYLSCVARLGESARSGATSPAFALEHGVGTPACKDPHLAYEACTVPCREGGVVRTGARSIARSGKPLNVQGELIATGCDRTEPLGARRAPAGAPCEHHSVCSTTRCDCRGRAYGYLARACVDGRCADSTLACDVVAEAVQYAPCVAGP